MIYLCRVEFVVYSNQLDLEPATLDRNIDAAAGKRYEAC